MKDAKDHEDLAKDQKKISARDRRRSSLKDQKISAKDQDDVAKDAKEQTWGMGDIVGHEELFLMGGKRVSSVVAASNTVLMVLSYCELGELYTSKPLLGMKILRMLGFAAVDENMRVVTRAASDLCRLTPERFPYLSTDPYLEYGSVLEKPKVKMLEAAGGQVNEVIDLFQEDEEDQDLFLEYFTLLKAEPGEVVIHASTEIDCVLLVLTGELEWTFEGADKPLGRTSKGNLLGESALLRDPHTPPPQHSLDANAGSGVGALMGGVTLAALSWQEFQRMHAERPLMAQRFFHHIAKLHVQRLVRTVNRLTEAEEKREMARKVAEAAAREEAKHQAMLAEEAREKAELEAAGMGGGESSVSSMDTPRQIDDLHGQDSKRKVNHHNKSMINNNILHIRRQCYTSWTPITYQNPYTLIRVSQII